jgi:hypothetical protein
MHQVEHNPGLLGNTPVEHLVCRQVAGQDSAAIGD